GGGHARAVPVVDHGGEQPRIGEAVGGDAAGGVHVDAGAVSIAAGAEGGVSHTRGELARRGQAGRAEQEDEGAGAEGARHRAHGSRSGVQAPANVAQGPRTRDGSSFFSAMQLSNISVYIRSAAWWHSAEASYKRRTI